MIPIFHEFLYRPLFNALIYLYQYFSFGDIGISIILLTVLIRLALFPLFYKGAKSQAVMQRLMPKIKTIQKNLKHDREKQAQEMFKLYKEHKVSPFSGFGMLFIQLPILIALYQVFLKGFSEGALNELYSFISRPEFLNHYFLGVIDLTQRSLVLVVLAAAVQYWQAKLAMPNSKSTNKQDLTQMEIMSRQMIFIGPILTVIFLYFFKLPSAVAIYWLTTSLFSVIQQIIINKKIKEDGTIKE